MMENLKMPELRFSEFKGEWLVVKLGDLTKIYDGTHQTPKYVKDGIPFYSVEHITANQFNQTKYITEDKYLEECRRVKIEKGDILMTRIGSIGVPKLIDWDVEASFYVSLALIKKTESFNSAYIHFAISCEGFQRELWRRTIHVAFPQKINLGEIGECKLYLPTLPEQQKIASFFTSIDKKIELLKKKHSLLEQYKKGVMQKIFSQEIRFKDHNGNNYPDWEEKKLGECMIERNKKTPKSEQYPLMSFVAYKGVSPKGERYNREFLVSDSKGKKYKQTEYGDFIYSSNNLETGSIGLNNYGSACISPVYSIFEIRQNCSSEFIGSYFIRKKFINKMIRFRQGVVYGQWRIHESEFLKIEENIPCIQEQTKIAIFLSSIDKKIEKVQLQIDKAEEWKKGLLGRMFC